MTFTAAARILLPLAVLPLLPAQVRFYRTMEIDPGSLVLRFSNEFPLRAGFPTEEYFQHSGIHVEHVVPLGRNQPVSHPDFSYVSRDLVLQQRRKFQEQFSGSFGAIIAESAYSYPGLDYGSPEIGFSGRFRVPIFALGGIGIEDRPYWPAAVDRLAGSRHRGIQKSRR